MAKAYDFIKAKGSNKRLVVLTAYDAPTAEVLEKAGVDMILVGDSVGMVLLGYPSTVYVTMDEMIHHAKAVRRGAPHSFIVGDMPFKGIERGPRQALISAKRFIREAGCNAVKIEWREDALSITDLLIENKIPVMGHVGLTPQKVRVKEGFKVQGQDAAKAIEIFRAAKAFEERGAFSMILECVPAPVARVITASLKIPTIGIGAGADCDGQVLVFHDLVGIFKKFTPRFVKRYAHLDAAITKAVARYTADVRSGKFPAKKHSFGMKQAEWIQFKTRSRHEG